MRLLNLRLVHTIVAVSANAEIQGTVERFDLPRDAAYFFKNEIPRNRKGRWGCFRDEATRGLVPAFIPFLEFEPPLFLK